MKTKLLSLLLALVMLVSLASCAAETETPDLTATSTVEEKTEETGLWKDARYTEDTTLGEGKKEICVEVTADDKTVTFTLKTDAKNLGEALLDTGLAEGEDGPYGLYIKKVNGITADYDIDQTYWSFCIDGEAQMKGVSDTEIAGGETFQLIRAK